MKKTNQEPIDDSVPLPWKGIALIVFACVSYAVGVVWMLTGFQL